MSDEKKTNWLGIVQTTATVAAAAELHSIKKTLAAQEARAQEDQRERTRAEMSQRAQEMNKSYRRSSSMYERDTADLQAQSLALRKFHSPELQAKLNAIDAGTYVPEPEITPIVAQKKDSSYTWLFWVVFAVGYVAMRHYL